MTPEELRERFPGVEHPEWPVGSRVRFLGTRIGPGYLLLSLGQEGVIVPSKVLVGLSVLFGDRRVQCWSDDLERVS